MEKVLIFGGTIGQSQNYAKYKGIQKDACVFVSNVNQIRSTNSKTLIVVGTWYNHESSNIIVDETVRRNIKIIKGSF